MIALPAVDLREGACVQLVGGQYENERVRLPDPVAVAEEWRAAGFSELHVIDLDAATGRGSNREVVRRLVARDIPTQVGGGVRDETAIRELLDLGAARVIVGTRALKDPVWLHQMAERFPNRLVAALDVQGRAPVVHGWQEALELDLLEVLGDWSALPLAGILMTAVHQEGRLQGPDLELMQSAGTVARVPLQASGGIRSLDDLRALSRIGIRASVLGMSLYTQTLDPRLVAEEFGR
jgi:phosphoribosylformimino-5-aminoimidazole carboxamide ribotide isomerase